MVTAHPTATKRSIWTRCFAGSTLVAGEEISFSGSLRRATVKRTLAASRTTIGRRPSPRPTWLASRRISWRLLPPFAAPPRASRCSRASVLLASCLAPRLIGHTPRGFHGMACRLLCRGNLRRRRLFLGYRRRNALCLRRLRLRFGPGGAPVVLNAVCDVWARVATSVPPLAGFIRALFSCANAAHRPATRGLFLASICLVSTRLGAIRSACLSDLVSIRQRPSDEGPALRDTVSSAALLRSSPSGRSRGVPAFAISAS